jgi:hypothetical protein
VPPAQDRFGVARSEFWVRWCFSRCCSGASSPSAEIRHKAKSWDRERCALAGIEATELGLDIRFVVTSLDVGSAGWIYDNTSITRAAKPENLVKPHKTLLASDRSALANQVRLVLHTAAYWLMVTPFPKPGNWPPLSRSSQRCLPKKRATGRPP